jgi:hypothetical protein
VVAVSWQFVAEYVGSGMSLLFIGLALTGRVTPLRIVLAMLFAGLAAAGFLALLR